MKRYFKPSLLGAATALALAACGGGGGESGAPVAAALKLSGVAATGAAIANAPVQAKCGSGTGTANTNTDGSYTIQITGGSLPCVLEVTPATGSALHSVVDGSGTANVNVNVTPLTELIVAKAAGAAPATLFANFDAAAQAKINASALAAAVASVTAALQGVVDLNGVNPIKDTLVVGNPLDQKLDTLKAALTAAQTTLADLTAAIAASGNTSAPVQTMLQPAASGCSGLRSGSYVAISPVENDPTVAASGVIEINAATLTVAYQVAGVTKSATMIDDGGCAYSIPDDGESSTKILVSKSGLSVARDTATTGVNAGKTWVSNIFIPMQSIPTSELAGTWNALEYFRDPANNIPTFSPSYGFLTIDESGTITAGTSCDSSNVCAPAEAIGGSLSVNPFGGFDIGGSAAEPPSRVFAFKTADGHLSMFLLYSNGRGMIVLSKQASLPLPEVGTVANIWDFAINNQGFASAMVNQSTTVTAVNGAAGTFTRQRAADNRVDSFKINDPQIGLRSRTTNSCTINGAPTACGGTFVMPLLGAGVGFYVPIAPENYFGVFIDKP